MQGVEASAESRGGAGEGDWHRDRRVLRRGFGELGALWRIAFLIRWYGAEGWWIGAGAGGGWEDGENLVGMVVNGGGGYIPSQLFEPVHGVLALAKRLQLLIHVVGKYRCICWTHPHFWHERFQISHRSAFVYVKYPS